MTAMHAMRSTPHAHTTYVDGISTAEEMVLAAIERNFVSLGFSEHAKQPIDPAYCLNEQTEAQYIAEVRRLQRAYSDKIRIWLGCERDLLSTADKADFDYVIASSHYFKVDEGWYPADGSSADIARCHRDLFHGDSMAMASTYYDNFARYVEQSAPDIIGHLDVITKNNDTLHLFDTEAPEYRNCVYSALERMIGGCDMIELNTGRVARGYSLYPNPDPFVLKRWHEMGGRVIVSSDCHDASKIDYAYDLCPALLRDAGFETAFALGTGDTLFEEYFLR